MVLTLHSNAHIYRQTEIKIRLEGRKSEMLQIVYYVVSERFMQMMELLNMYMCLKDCNRTNLLFT